jgi:hypothetical protein
MIVRYEVQMWLFKKIWRVAQMDYLSTLAKKVKTRMLKKVIIKSIKRILNMWATRSDNAALIYFHIDNSQIIKSFYARPEEERAYKHQIATDYKHLEGRR